jgi:hypothetical protein
VPTGVDRYEKSIFKNKKKSSGPDPDRQVEVASPGGSRRQIEVTMPGRGRVSGGCAAMEDGAEGSVEAALWRWRSRAWRPWWAPVVEAAMADGAAVVNPKEKGAAPPLRMETRVGGGWKSRCHRGEGSCCRQSGEGSCHPLSRKEEATPWRRRV